LEAGKLSINGPGSSIGRLLVQNAVNRVLELHKTQSLANSRTDRKLAAFVETYEFSDKTGAAFERKLVDLGLILVLTL
jgi:hypothetical protein